MTESDRDRAGENPLDPEKWLREALAVAPIGVIVVDRDGLIRAANQQANNMFGYEQTGLVGRPVDTLLPQRLRDLHATFRADYVKTPHARPMGSGQELRARRQDGSEFVVEIGLNPLFDDIEGMVVCTILDVTARITTQNVLQVQDTRQRMIVDNIAEGIVSVDEAGIVSSFNRAAERIFGYRAYGVLGRPATMLMAPPYRRLSKRGLKHLIKFGLQPLLGQTIEAIGRRADGTPVLLELTLDRAEAGSGAVITGIVSDISARRAQEVAVEAIRQEKARVESELVEAEGKFRHLIDRANVVAYTWDLVQQRFLSVGPRARALLGYEESEWLQLGFWERVTFAEDWDSVSHEIDPHAATQNDHETQYRMAHRDGRTVWVRDVLANERIARGQHIIHGFLFDVTEMRQRDLQLAHARKLDAVSQLTGGIAHDFNNLLAVVIGNLDMLSEATELPVRMQEQVQLALSAALRGAELTKQMLAFSQQQDMRAQQLNLGDVVARMVRLLRRTLGGQYDFHHVEATGVWDVFLDPNQLETALLNLALNSRDAMSSGGTIAISIENSTLAADYCDNNPDARPGDYVCVSVSDTGTGIAPDIIGRVFDPFFTTKMVGKGSGLGLSMIYGFVKQSGGHVRIYSEIGHGTTVRLYLPRFRPGLDSNAAIATPVEDPRGNGEVILVVEDDAQVRQVVRTQLQDLGYQVLLAETGPRALEIARQRDDIALVFTDVIMPGGMFGADLAEAMRALRPDLRILFTSGFTGAGEQLSRVLAIGPLITKPFRKAELAQSIRALLER